MRKVVVDVEGLLSVLSARGVEKRLARLSGVRNVEVNYVAGSASVEYDETVTDLKTIKTEIHECGYRCRGEMLPKHVCIPEDPPEEIVSSGEITPQRSQAEEAGHAKHAEHVTMRHRMKDEGMKHEGMDMQVMVRDSATASELPLSSVCRSSSILLWGMKFIALKPPFGMDLPLHRGRAIKEVPSPLVGEGYGEVVYSILNR